MYNLPEIGLILTNEFYAAAHFIKDNEDDPVKYTIGVCIDILENTLDKYNSYINSNMFNVLNLMHNTNISTNHYIIVLFILYVLHEMGHIHTYYYLYHYLKIDGASMNAYNNIISSTEYMLFNHIHDEELLNYAHYFNSMEGAANVFMYQNFPNVWRYLEDNEYIKEAYQ